MRFLILIFRKNSPPPSLPSQSVHSSLFLAKLGSCHSEHLADFSRTFPIWRGFVAFQRRIPLSGSVQNPQGFRAVSAANSLLEIFLGAQGGNLFRHRDLDQLIQD
jgi:hypothetical protein